MSYDYILFEKKDRVGTITLNRPDVLNAFIPPMSAEVQQALRVCENDRDVGCVVLTGAGRGFSAGADIKGFMDRVESREQGGEEAVDSDVKRRAGWTDETPLPKADDNMALYMASMKKPIIAAINGPAVGFGLTVALPCDIRIASDKAKMGMIFVKRGLTPEYSSLYFLPRIVGLAKAQELCLTGKIIMADEALKVGLVNHVVEHDKLMDFTYEMAREIANGPPMAIAITKRGLNISLESSLQAMQQYDVFAFSATFNSWDHGEGVRSFVEKRPPKFQGR